MKPATASAVVSHLPQTNKLQVLYGDGQLPRWYQPGTSKLPVLPTGQMSKPIGPPPNGDLAARA